MKKDFDTWNLQKKKIHNFIKQETTFREREIWWCSLGINIGDEEDGKNTLFERPILVLRKFNRKLAWVLPMSSKKKEGVYYHIINYRGISYSVLLSQLRLISAKRLRRFIRKISPTQDRE